MQDTTVICNHFSGYAQNFHYGNQDNILYGNNRVLSSRVILHLSCSKCGVLTPKVLVNHRVAIKEKSREIIYYKVLSFFAALLALPIRTSIDPTKHPTLARMGRILALPSFYVECAVRELEAYRRIEHAKEKFEEDEDENNFKYFLNFERWSIIEAQFNRALVTTYAYAKPSEIKNLSIHFQHSNGKPYSDAEYDQRRLPNLRNDPLKDLKQKPILYKTLFEKGYLVSP